MDVNNDRSDIESVDSGILDNADDIDDKEVVPLDTDIVVNNNNGDINKEEKVEIKTNNAFCSSEIGFDNQEKEIKEQHIEIKEQESKMKESHNEMKEQENKIIDKENGIKQQQENEINDQENKMKEQYNEMKEKVNETKEKGNETKEQINKTKEQENETKQQENKMKEQENETKEETCQDSSEDNNDKLNVKDEDTDKKNTDKGFGKENSNLSYPDKVYTDSDFGKDNLDLTESVVTINPEDSVSVCEVGVEVDRDNLHIQHYNRGSRGVQPDTKDAVFQQALNLMAERTVSRPASKSSFKPRTAHRESIAIGLRGREGTQTPIVGTKTYPFGFQHPEYFYVHQQKPSPMAPIPAWKGYNGNVYFTPINIQQAQASAQNPPKSPDMERCSPVLQQILMRSRSRNNNHLSSASVYSGSSQGQRVQSGDSIRSRRAMMSRAKVGRSSSMMSIKSNHSKSSANIGCKNLLVLDKRNVLSSSNDNIQDDIVVLSSQESTGSLCVLDPGVYVGSSQRQTPQYKQQQQHKKPSERIVKGSVIVRKITPKTNKRGGGRPLLSVSGDKFNQAPSPSPLLRTQTQYSQSHQRAVLSPDNMSYHSFTQSYEKLPPLEQLKASLRQIENSPSKESLLQVITPQERMRFEDSMDYKKQPFIKFSPELRHGVKPKPDRHHQSVK